MLEDKILADYLIDFIKKEIRKEINNAKFMNSYAGKVTVVGTGTLDVNLAGSTVTLSGLKNKTNVTVNVNDEVIVVALKGNLSNAFVAWKK